MSFDIAAFYKFQAMTDIARLRDEILQRLMAMGVKGSLLLAPEGLNGTIAAPSGAIAAAIQYIEKAAQTGALDCKYSRSQLPPFKRMKVRLKKEIVASGDPTINPNEIVGQYVDPTEWNALISDPETIIIDTRNTYELRLGTFHNAIDPGTEAFSEFPEFVRQNISAGKSRKIAMFCTGGIRCEKASSFMRREGFENVFHLRGGILKYLESVPREDSLFNGECFVFDERVAVGHGLEQGAATMCHGCLEPLTVEDRLSPLFEVGVCCHRCAGTLSETQKASNRERQRQVELGNATGKRHLGPAH